MAAPDHADHLHRRFFLRPRGRPHMTVGDGHAQPLAARGSAVGAGHVRARPGLVDEHEPFRVEIRLAVEPGLPARQDVRALLFAGVRGLFLRVQPRRWKNRHNVPYPKGSPRSANSARSSSRLMSRCASKTSRIVSA